MHDKPDFKRNPLPLPDGHDKLLLHSCCAPCSGEVMEAMLASGIDFTIFFYNPNIHPQKEYELRKEREHPLRGKARRALYRRRLRQRQLVRARQGHGKRTGEGHPLHHVLRHALRAHRAVCARTRLSGHY